MCLESAFDMPGVGGGFEGGLPRSMPLVPALVEHVISLARERACFEVMMEQRSR